MADRLTTSYSDQCSWRRYATNASRSSCFRSTGVIPPLVILLSGARRSAINCASVYFWPMPVRGPAAAVPTAAVSVAGVAGVSLEEGLSLQYRWVGRGQCSGGTPCRGFRHKGLLHEGLRILILLAHLRRHSRISIVVPITGYYQETYRQSGREGMRPLRLAVRHGRRSSRRSRNGAAAKISASTAGRTMPPISDQRPLRYLSH